jgi:hypothetical protein
MLTFGDSPFDSLWIIAAMKRRFSTDDENVPSNGINNLADTFIAERDYFLVEAVEARLSFLDQLWLKLTGAISRDINLHLPALTLDRLGGVPLRELPELSPAESCLS